MAIYLYGAEDPQNEGLNDYKCSGPEAKSKVDADVFAHVAVAAVVAVDLSPLLQPNAAA